MPSANQPDEPNQLLISIHVTLRRHEQALHSLALDVAGLTALVTDANLLRPFADRQKIFEDAREIARGKDAFGFDSVLNSLDAIIERLRGS